MNDNGAFAAGIKNKLQCFSFVDSNIHNQDIIEHFKRKADFAFGSSKGIYLRGCMDKQATHTKEDSWYQFSKTAHSINLK
jgi:hypothetical protein